MKNTKISKTSSRKTIRKAKTSSRKTTTKNPAKKISIKDSLSKVILTVKKPFAKTNNKKPVNKPRKEKILISKPKKQQLQVLNGNSLEQEQHQNDKAKLLLQIALQQNLPDVPFAESSTTTSESKFFYSIDDKIDNIDDPLLYLMVSRLYPGLHAEECNENTKRNAIVNLLNDVKTMLKILDEYNMTIMDFFAFLFRLCPSVFKGLFVKKVLKTIKNKPYALSLKFGKYTLKRAKVSSKRCSIF